MLISPCIPFILGTSPLSVFSTTGNEELKEIKELEAQFERMKFERMKGEQTTCFQLIISVKLNQERC